MGVELQASQPKLLALASETDQKGPLKASPGLDCQIPNNCYFKSAQWTNDGTSIITDTADNRVQTFIIPPDLLEEREHEISLTYYAEIKFPEALRAKAIYPLFDLQDFSTTLVLCSVPDHSLRLHSALTGELIGAYPFVHTTTEAYISPHSLVFADSGRSFVGGSNNLLATFDISRPGEGPTNLFTTAPSRKRSKAANATALKGIVSALSIERSSNILAAGTFSRHIGLYDAAGKGESLGVFRVNGNEADCSIGGKGVTQLMWSPCGRYLYIVERQSCGIMVYDIRKSGQLLSWVKGRNAETNQRLGCDLSSSPHGGGVLELWAGGVDGNIRVWKDTHHREGPQEPDLVWNVHNDAVSSTIVHFSGSVVASCSGQRHFETQKSSSSDSNDSDDDTDYGFNQVKSSTYDNSLKLWAK